MIGKRCAALAPLVLAILWVSSVDPVTAGTNSGAKRVYVAQLNSSNQSGSVLLAPKGTATFVTVDLSREPRDIFEPAHIHLGASCSSMDPKPTYPLRSVHDGHSYTLVPQSMGKLMSGTYNVNFHSSTDITHYVACGHI